MWASTFQRICPDGADWELTGKAWFETATVAAANMCLVRLLVNVHRQKN